jgi:hypothetical protein
MLIEEERKVINNLLLAVFMLVTGLFYICWLPLLRIVYIGITVGREELTDEEKYLNAIDSYSCKL